ncbi:FMN-binding negative transcriptional regulator [Flavihumibacter sp. UBA7668]|uniref:FMN-binding negative transcriptional regulator n=1 Tax=Flavihumibacter sp. UBA7668 TaxID=1946542 RepID=UPI0025BFA0B0|nr:FMN-binding negative transcriptional regulator [Flavihumibacter sp. UBA7668]
MYISSAFKFEGKEEMIAFMKRYSFATIVTVVDGLPVASQLPFIILEKEGKLILRSHFALVNEQAKHIESAVSLIMFSQPHAYISPAHYDKQESVPTWNYLAVHAYGRAVIITDENAVEDMLEELILTYESGYLKQWKGLPEKYRSGMKKGILAFDLEVIDLQGKKKLSQNKNLMEIQRIATELESSQDTAEKDLAAYMRSLPGAK